MIFIYQTLANLMYPVNARQRHQNAFSDEEGNWLSLHTFEALSHKCLEKSHFCSVIAYSTLKLHSFNSVI